MAVLAVLILLLIIFGFLFPRLTPPPRAALALLGGAALAYVISRLFAFRFFLPRRYFEYGAPAAGLLFAVSAFGLSIPKIKPPLKPALRNFAACCLMAAFAVFVPGAIRHDNGMKINGRDFARLYDFVRTLPAGVRIACHPDDGDNIPYWAGRATTGGRETILPFLVETWQIHKARTKDTLKALYATEREDFLSYCEKYEVTHLLLNTKRYGPGFKKAASLFEPFDSFIRRMMAPLERKDLALLHLPDEAVVFHNGNYLLVDVKRLRRLWP